MSECCLIVIAEKSPALQHNHIIWEDWTAVALPLGVITSSFPVIEDCILSETEAGPTTRKIWLSLPTCLFCRFWTNSASSLRRKWGLMRAFLPISARLRSWNAYLQSLSLSSTSGTNMTATFLGYKGDKDSFGVLGTQSEAAQIPSRRSERAVLRNRLRIFHAAPCQWVMCCCNSATLRRQHGRCPPSTLRAFPLSLLPLHMVPASLSPTPCSDYRLQH